MESDEENMEAILQDHHTQFFDSRFFGEVLLHWRYLVRKHAVMVKSLLPKIEQRLVFHKIGYHILAIANIGHPLMYHRKILGRSVCYYTLHNKWL